MNGKFPLCEDWLCPAYNFGKCVQTACTKYMSFTYTNGTQLNKEYIQCPHCGQMIEKK